MMNNLIKTGYYKCHSIPKSYHGGVEFNSNTDIYIYIYDDKILLFAMACGSDLPDIEILKNQELIKGEIKNLDNNRFIIESYSNTRLFHGIIQENDDLYLKEVVEDNSIPHIDNIFTYIGENI